MNINNQQNQPQDEREVLEKYATNLMNSHATANWTL